MSLQEWLFFVLACAAAVVGLLLAASDNGSTGYTVGFMVFVAAVAYAFMTLKRYFDRADAMRH